MKSVFFFCNQMHIYSPHLITDHQSQTEWAWEGRETAKPHERRLRIHLSFYYCKSQSSKALSLEDLTSHFGLFSDSYFIKSTWKARLPEELLSVCLHVLTHDCKRIKVLSRTRTFPRKPSFRLRPKWVVQLEEWSPHSVPNTHTHTHGHSVLQYVYSVEVCH